MTQEHDRKKPDKSLLLCCGIFTVYAVLTLIGAANHELWFDEAQAWNIARDNDIKGIFQQLGYEGHPPLWYLILYIPARMGLSCEVIPFISWSITAAAGALVLFKAPFNLITRSALLFSGGFLYINSVMSRVYCLINLFAVLIAVLYPHRKRFPVLYGVLIALLANTHVFMCGFIGILGIFMLIDLFKDFKAKSAKQKTKELIGLAAAGIGVLMLVLPLLNSLSLNNSTSQHTISFADVLLGFVNSFTNISYSIVSYGHQIGSAMEINLLEYLLGLLTAASIIAMMILVRHKTRPFLVLLVYWFFYTVVSEIIWVTIPNRALIFALMLFVTAWIAEYEPSGNKAGARDKNAPKADTRLLKKLLGLVMRADKNYKKSYIVLMTAVLLFSIPAAARYLFEDYVKPFCPSKLTAEFIKEELPADSVFVTDNELLPQVLAYLPDRKFYALDFGRFYTYDTNESLDKADEADYEHIFKDLKDCEDLYYIYAHTYPDYDFISDDQNEVFLVSGGLAYGINVRCVRIVDFTLEPGNGFWFIDKLIDS